MISFLNSGFLFLSSALIVPVLIYLFARKRPKKIIFSSIRFIKESQQQQKKRINLKNLLLLLIRMLIILCVILAISRPALRLPFLAKSNLHPKTAVAVIIDNSYSMNYLVDTQTELEKAKAIALQINDMLAADDQVVLLTLSENWNLLNGNIRFGKLDQSLINNIDITTRHSKLADILQLAEQKIQSTHLPNREIIIISDRQSVELPDRFTIPTFYISTSDLEQRQNISLQNSQIITDIVRKGKTTLISFELHNHADNEMQDVIYRLFLDGSTLSEKATDLLAGQQKTDSFEIDVQTAGWHSGFVEVKDERQTYDNRNYFSFYQNLTPKVAYISDQTNIPLALASILDIYRGNDNALDFPADSELSVVKLGSYNNVIIYNKTFSNKLAFILENSESFLFIADKELSEQWQNWLVGSFELEFSSFTKTPSLLSYSNRYHPVIKHLNNINQIEINDFWQTGANSYSLLKTGKNAAALMQERKALWLFDVNSLQNPFLLDAAFPVFAYNTLSFLADGAQFQAYTVGDRIKAKKLELPGGKTIEISDESYFTTQPGIFKSSEKSFAVNLDYSESDYSRLKDPELQNLTFTGRDWQQQILHSRYGFELWKYLLILALILFGLEILLVKREEKK